MCDCGLNSSFALCCGRYLDSETPAPTPEALMRSRYSAFCRKNGQYLENTQDPQTRSPLDTKANNEWARGVEFINLEVRRSSEEGTKGVVEFVATFRDLATCQIHTHHEISRFRKQAGRWYFRDGKIQQPAQQPPVTNSSSAKDK